MITTKKLVGLSEIAEMATPPVTRQAVANWRLRYDDFPQPAETLQQGPVWDAEIVKAWLDARSGRATTVVSVINLKGGVAKTTTAVAIAEALAQDFRKHVLFIDLDPQTNASINLIGEERWMRQNEDGGTLAQLFKDKLEPHRAPVFDIEKAIVRSVSKIGGGISRLDLLPSSIEFIDIQEKLPFVAMQGNYDRNPQEILRLALLPVIDRYDFVIIDCPPSLGIVTKNGLRFSTHYLIPTIPDYVSTWGIYQIVSKVTTFSDELGRPIKPIGIVATKVNGVNSLHSEVTRTLREGKLFDGKDTDLKQPPLFVDIVKEATVTSRGSEFTANVSTFKQKYGPNADALTAITKELLQRCSPVRA